jgi:hypothetical protein
VKGCSIADRGDGCRCDQRSDSRDLPQSFAVFILDGNPLDVVAGCLNVVIQLSPLNPESIE